MQEAENEGRILVSCSWLWGKGTGKREASAGRRRSRQLHASSVIRSGFLSRSLGTSRGLELRPSSLADPRASGARGTPALEDACLIIIIIIIHPSSYICIFLSVTLKMSLRSVQMTQPHLRAQTQNSREKWALT